MTKQFIFFISILLLSQTLWCGKNNKNNNNGNGVFNKFTGFLKNVFTKDEPQSESGNPLESPLLKHQVADHHEGDDTKTNHKSQQDDKKPLRSLINTSHIESTHMKAEDKPASLSIYGINTHERDELVLAASGWSVKGFIPFSQLGNYFVNLFGLFLRAIDESAGSFELDNYVDKILTSFKSAINEAKIQKKLVGTEYFVAYSYTEDSLEDIKSTLNELLEDKGSVHRMLSRKLSDDATIEAQRKETHEEIYSSLNGIMDLIDKIENEDNLEITSINYTTLEDYTQPQNIADLIKIIDQINSKEYYFPNDFNKSSFYEKIQQPVANFKNALKSSKDERMFLLVNELVSSIVHLGNSTKTENGKHMSFSKLLFERLENLISSSIDFVSTDCLGMKSKKICDTFIRDLENLQDNLSSRPELYTSELEQSTQISQNSAKEATKLSSESSEFNDSSLSDDERRAKLLRIYGAALNDSEDPNSIFYKNAESVIAANFITILHRSVELIYYSKTSIEIIEPFVDYIEIMKNFFDNSEHRRIQLIDGRIADYYKHPLALCAEVKQATSRLFDIFGNESNFDLSDGDQATAHDIAYNNLEVLKEKINDFKYTTNQCRDVVYIGFLNNKRTSYVSPKKTEAAVEASNHSNKSNINLNIPVTDLSSTDNDPHNIDNEEELPSDSVFLHMPTENNAGEHGNVEWSELPYGENINGHQGNSDINAQAHGNNNSNNEDVSAKIGTTASKGQNVPKVIRIIVLVEPVECMQCVNDTDFAKYFMRFFQ